MTANAQALRIVEQLRLAVGSGRLPVTARETGGRLLTRLSAPVRLAILGPSGSGKARVRDILAGRAVVPPEARLTSVELSFGRHEQGRLVYSDGSTERYDGAPPRSADWSRVALVRMQAPLPVLEHISLLEVVADDPQDDLVAAVNWAVRRCDMVLWCTSDFGPAEIKAWAVVPDRLKDHTFLVPRLPRGGVFPGMIREDVVGLLPVHDEPGVEDGAAALRAAVLSHVDRGRREDFDGALLFLERFKVAQSAAPQSSGTAAAGSQTPPKRDPAADRPEKTMAGGADAASDRPSDSTTPSPDVDQETASPSDSAAFEMLRAVATDIDAQIAEAAPNWPGKVLSLCVETVEGLPLPPPGDRELVDLLSEASDLMMLLQLEADASAAADAVSVVVQVRRALEQRLVAA